MRPLALMLLVCLASGWGGCASAPKPLDELAWTRIESPNFVMLSASNAGASAALLEDLERFRTALPQLSDVEPHPERLHVVLLPSLEQLARLHNGSSLRSFWVSGPDRTWLVSCSGVSAPDAALRHAYIHASARMGGGAPPPPWFEEGRAELLAHAQLSQRTARIGDLPEHLGHWLEHGRPLTLRRMLGAGAGRITWSSGENLRFDSYAWSLAHLMWIRPKAGEGAETAELRTLLERAAGVTVPGDLEASVLAAAEPLDQAFVKQVRRESFHSEIKTLTEPAIAPALSSTPAQAGDALRELARVARAAGIPDLAFGDPERSDGPEATPHSAEERHALLTERETALGETAAADAWLQLGDEWKALAADAPDTDTRERAAYRRAYALAPASPAANLAVASTLGEEPADHWSAVTLLQRLRAERPAVPSIELEMARRLLGAGQRRAAGHILSDLASAPHAGATIDPEVVGALLERTGRSLDAQEAGLRAAQLSVRTPAPDAVLEQMAPWVEVVGSAGLGEPPRYDVIVAIDLSQAAHRATGQDIDGDGRVGRTEFEVPIDHGLRRETTTQRIETSSDPGDSILAASVWVAIDLIERLDPETTRVGVVGYGRRAVMIAPLGSPIDTLGILERFRTPMVAPELAGLDVGMLAAVAILRKEALPDDPRQASVWLMSGTPPRYPSPGRARRRAVEAARYLGQLGIRVDTFGIGNKGIGRYGASLEQLSELAGGTHTPVVDVTNLPDPTLGKPLLGLESVTMRNVTTGAPARAVRHFADGSFDGMVPLARGDNLIEISARSTGRPERTENRRVVYSPPEEPTEAHRRRAAVQLWELRNRSIEVAARLQLADALAEREADVAAAASQRRNIRLDVEDDGSDPDAAPDANPPVSAGPQPN